MHRLLYNFAVATTLVLGSTTSFAAPVTHALSITYDGTAPILDTTFTGPTLSFHNRGFGTASIAPFAVGEGDTIETTINFTGGGLTLNAGPSPVSQGFFLNFSSSAFNFSTHNPDNDPVLSYDRTREGAVTSFTGDYSGDVVNAPQVGAPPNASPSFQVGALGDFTGSTVTIFQMTLTSTFTNIAYLPGFESWDGTLLDTVSLSVLEINSVTVPTPGALALLGFGLIGLGMRRVIR